MPLSTYIIVVIAPLVFMHRFYWRHDESNYLLTSGLAFLSALVSWSHYKAMRMDPGFVSIKANDIELECAGETKDNCKKCHAKK